MANDQVHLWLSPVLLDEALPAARGSDVSAQGRSFMVALLPVYVPLYAGKIKLEGEMQGEGAPLHFSSIDF
jgi:hypothetical protein